MLSYAFGPPLPPLSSPCWRVWWSHLCSYYTKRRRIRERKGGHCRSVSWGGDGNLDLNKTRVKKVGLFQYSLPSIRETLINTSSLIIDLGYFFHDRNPNFKGHDNYFFCIAARRTLRWCRTSPSWRRFFRLGHFQILVSNFVRKNPFPFNETKTIPKDICVFWPPS